MGISRIVDKIRLSSAKIQSVAQARKSLKNAVRYRARKGELPVPKSFNIIGSYKRGTKISPLDDVDIFYVIGEGWENGRGGWEVNINANAILLRNFIDTGGISSIKVLNYIKKVLSKKYHSSTVKRNHEVVNIYLSTYNVGFDIVPAIYIPESGYYIIPFGKQNAGWKKSNPDLDIYILDKLNTRHNGKLKNTIRVVKYWFRKKKIKSLRSFHLESIMYYMYSKAPPMSTYWEMLMYFYQQIIENYRDYLYACPDPTGLSEDLDSGLTEDDVNRIVSEAFIAQIALLEGEDIFEQYVG